MKLKNAAQMTAALGASTRVDTTVAIEFAASCRPFMKSNSNATPIRPKMANEPSEASSIRLAPGQTCLAVTVCTTLATSSHLSTTRSISS